MTFVEVFRLDGTDTVYTCKFATLVGMVFDHYIRVVCWHFPICIIIINYYYYYYYYYYIIDSSFLFVD